MKKKTMLPFTVVEPKCPKCGADLLFATSTTTYNNINAVVIGKDNGFQCDIGENVGCYDEKSWFECENCGEIKVGEIK